MTSRAKEMLSTLLRPRKGNNKQQQRVDSSMFDSNPNTPSPGPATRRQQLEPRHATADFTEAEDDEEDEEEELNEEEEDVGDLPRFTQRRPDRGLHEAEGRRSSASMIPLFSASYLGEQDAFETKRNMFTDPSLKILYPSIASYMPSESSFRQGPKLVYPGNNYDPPKSPNFLSSQCSNRSGHSISPGQHCMR
jgi:hypothetical protein